MSEKSARGGARPGAGRKPTGRLRKSVTFTWPVELWQQIEIAAKAEGLSRSQWLENLARKELGKM